MIPAGTGSIRHRGLALGLGLLGLGVFGFALWRNQAFIHDDTYITLRYARNLLEGHGLVWNPGERVEGYTSLVAVLLASGLGFLGIDGVTSVRIVNGIAVLGLGAYLVLFCMRRSTAPGASAVVCAIPVLLVLGSFPLAIWTCGGLEAPLFMAWAAVAVGTMSDVLMEPASRARAARVGFLFGLGALIRPEAVLFAFVSFLFLVSGVRPGGRRSRGELGAFLVAFVVLPGLHLAFRLAYYGSFFPNTVVAKASGVPNDLLREGSRYLGRFLQAPPHLLLLAAALSVPALLDRSQRLQMIFLLACIGAYAAGIVGVGGDHMTAFRLFLPLVPLAAMVVFYGLSRLLRGARQVVVLVVALYAVLLVGIQVSHFAPVQADPAAFVGKIVGEHLRDTRSPGTLVALNTAGSTPYFAPRLRYVDMLGLLDRHIARRKVERTRLRRQRMPGHNKGDGQYVLDREPDLIVIGPAEGVSVDEPWFLGDLELMENPGFHERYRLQEVVLDVRDRVGYERHRATASGSLHFRYYSRVLD